MTADQRSSQPMSCLWMRPICNPPSQVFLLPAPLCVLWGCRALICQLLVSHRAAEGHHCGSVQLKVSPCSAATVAQRQVSYQPRLLYCAAFQPCTNTFFSYHFCWVPHLSRSSHWLFLKSEERGRENVYVSLFIWFFTETFAHSYYLEDKHGVRYNSDK